MRVPPARTMNVGGLGVKLKVGNRLLDANFSVESGDDWGALAITLESRGPNRNPDYTDCLHVLLRALCDAEAMISSIEVVSQRTKNLDVSSRQLALRYPIQLSVKTDLAKLKNRIGDLQRQIGSDAKTRGGGNRTRRLCIVCQITNFTNQELIDSAVDSGSSLRRRAFVLLWNPAYWPIEDYVSELHEIRQGSLGQWSTGARQSGIFEGDIVLLLQVGREGKGLIGCGTARTPRGRGVECVFRGKHWSKKNADASYINVEWSDLVHPDDRYSADFFVKQFPQVSWTHLQGSGAQIPTDVAISLVKQFQGHVSNDSLESPEVADARAEIRSLAGKTPKSSWGGRRRTRAARLTSEQRRSIEIRAMNLARSHLKRQGWTNIIDTSAGNPFDFYCKRAGSEIWVEVKGTTSTGASVVLTRNEVKHHRSVHPSSSLIVVHTIRLSGPSRTKATEGTLLEISPWQIHEMDLDPIGYDYTTGL